MRHLLRNFTQSVLPELGDGIDDGPRIEGETLPLCKCPACHQECRYDPRCADTWRCSRASQCTRCCGVCCTIGANVRDWRASRQGREARMEIDELVFLPRGSLHVGLGEELLEDATCKQAKALFEQAKYELGCFGRREGAAEREGVCRACHAGRRRHAARATARAA